LVNRYVVNPRILVFLMVGCFLTSFIPTLGYGRTVLHPIEPVRFADVLGPAPQQPKPELVTLVQLPTTNFLPADSVLTLIEHRLEEPAAKWVMDEVESDDFMDEGGSDDFMGDLESEFDEERKVVSDPLEGYNRMMTGFNDWFYLSILYPVAGGWNWLAPEPVRTSLYRMFHNLLYPVRFVNTLLQAKPVAALEETGRFVLNSTVGILGLFDPAKAWFGLEAHDEDFGQTLGLWGVGAGPHLVLPFLGPSNLRDTFAMVPEWPLDPVSYVKSSSQQLGVRSFDQVNETSLDLKGYESIKNDAVDLYPFLRDLYEQNRNQKIKD